MGRFINNQESFTAGEISQLVQGRSSVDQYKQGLSECLNMIPLKGGANQRRNGSKYHFTIAHDSTYTLEGGAAEAVTDVKFIPYKLSNDEQYVVAILKLQTKIRIQFYNVGGYPSLVYGIGLFSSTLGTDYIPYATNIQNFQYSQSGTLMILTHEDRTIPPLFVSLRSPTGTPKWYMNFLNPVAPTSGVISDIANYNLSTQGWITIVGGGTPVTSSEFLATRNHGLSGHYSVMTQAFRDINSTQTTMTGGAVSGFTYIDSSTAYFTLGMVGSWIKLTNGTTTGVALITEYVSTTKVNVAVIRNITTSPTKLWEISAWNSSFGFPATSSFFEQRTVLGSTLDQPDSFWGSQTANLSMFMAKRLAQDSSTDTSGFNYFGAVADSDPFAFQVASNEVNKIQWLLATRTLYAGSIGAEYTISGANSALSASSFNISPESNIGSSFVQPLAVDMSVVHVSRDGKSIRQLKYSFNNGSVLSKDLSILGERIESSLITDFVSAKFTNLAINKTKGLIFCLISNATESCILSLLVDETVNVLGWAKHQLAGTNKITSFCSAQSADSSKEEFICSVKRNIAGSDVFTMEVISNAFEGASLVDYMGTTGSIANESYYLAPIYSDCAYIYDGAAATVFTHPVLRSVDVVGLRDGVYFTGTLNASGQITLPSSSKVIMGLAFTSRMKLLPPNLGAFGNNDGIPSLKRLDKFWIRYLRTKHLLFGTSSTNMLNLEIDTALTSTTLFSDTKSKAINHSNEFIPQIIIETDKPFPATILQVGYRGVTEEV